MPVCGFCGEEVEVVCECNKCGVYFCIECGNPKKVICKFCAEEDIEEDIDIA